MTCSNPEECICIKFFFNCSLASPNKKNNSSYLVKLIICKGILFLLIIHNKMASQCKMQISEYVLFVGSIGGFHEI